MQDKRAIGKMEQVECDCQRLQKSFTARVAIAAMLERLSWETQHETVHGAGSSVPVYLA